MALTVETGAGSSTADAYDSLANVETYITNYHSATDLVAWQALSTGVQELAVRRATQYLDIVYGPEWRGYRANDTQALDWPRADVYDADGYAIDSAVVPTELKRAMAEATFRFTTEDMLPDEDAPIGDLQRKKIKVGPVEIDKAFAAAGETLKRYNLIERLLEPLIVTPGTTSRA